APAGAQQFAIVTTNAPIYEAAREAPTPLRVAAVGTRLRVISIADDWVQVEYNDPQLGRRVGWVLRYYVSTTNQDLRPMDLSVPEAPPPPGPPQQSVSVQVTPTPTASHPVTARFPRSETALGWSFLHISQQLLDLTSA